MKKIMVNRFLCSLLILVAIALFSFSGCSHDQKLDPISSDVSPLTPPSQAAPVEFEDEESDLARKRNDYLKARFHYGEIDPEVLLQMTREEYERREAEKNIPFSERTSDGGAWISLGPDNESNPNDNSGYGAGRLTAVVPHPSIMGTLYVGSETGGVWKTTDNGNSWNSLTDSIPNLSVMSMAIAPSNPNVIYVGTGATFAQGIGVLKSIDGGQTWILPTQVLSSSGFNCISVHPTNPNELVVGTRTGVMYRSTDGGSTWTQPLGQQWVSDFARTSMNPQVIYAASYDSTARQRRVYKSSDGGLTWIERSVGLPPSDSRDYTYLKVKMAMSPSNPQILYLTMMIYGANDEQVSHVFRSTDGGDNWVDLPNVYTNSDSRIRGFLGTQTFIHMEITVNPSNPNEVYAGGVSNIRTTDGGQTWVPSFNQCPTNCIHADLIDMAWQGSNLYMAGDGGVFTTSNGGQTASSRNLGLIVRQYYSLFSDSNNPNRIYAGSQDNGTDRRVDSGGMRWKFIFGGDGFDSAVNRSNSEIAYVTYQYGEIYRTNNASAQFPTWTRVSPTFPSGEWRPFGTPLTIDPNFPDTLYSGNFRVWKTSDAGNSWFPLPTTTTDGSTWNNNFAGKVYIAPSNSQILIVPKFDRVFRSSNGGNTWASISVGCVSNPVNDVSISSQNPNLIFATNVCRASGGLGGVYMSTDGGAAWTERTNGLPNFRSSAIEIDILDPNIIYLATNVGVFRSTNQGSTWSRFGSGLPATIVSDMEITADNSKLRLVTYGRGAWEYQLPATRTTLFDFDGDAKTDVSIFRPGQGEWWYLRSFDGSNRAFQFGQGTDKVAAADFTGDGKTDVAFWRPNLGEWYILRSEDSSFYAFPFGTAGDISIPADFDGDGKADPAIFRPSNATWYVLNSSGGTTIQQFGATGDLPVFGDFDGDGKSDLAIFRPSNGQWWINRSSNQTTNVFSFGTNTDKTVPADYTGDGKTDVAFFRPSSGEWFILRSEDASFYSFPFGTAGDVPAPGDYDGDGKTDPTVFRPSNSTWFKLQSTSGFEAITFGITNDIPVPSAFVR